MKYIVPIQWCIIGALLTLLVSGCTHTDEGKRMQAYNVADIGSTGIALTVVENAYEANPLGWALLPIKFGMVKWADGKPCNQRRSAVTGLAGFWGGAAANNLMIIAYPPAAIPVGIATGVGLAAREYYKTEDICGDTEDIVNTIAYLADADRVRIRLNTNGRVNTIRRDLPRAERDLF